MNTAKRRSQSAAEVIGLAGITLSTGAAHAQISFGDPMSFPAPGPFYSIDSGDITDDGVLDVVLGDDARIVIMAGAPGGGFEVSQIIDLNAPVRAPWDLYIADVDADGLLDIAWIAASETANQIAIGYFFVDQIVQGELVGEHVTVFQESDSGFLHYLALGDFDSDADLDAVYTETDGFFGHFYYSEQRLCLLRNGGGRAFSREVLHAFESDIANERDIVGVAVGDFDHDGDLDTATTLEDFYSYGKYGVDISTYLVTLRNTDGRMEDPGRRDHRLPWTEDDRVNLINLVSADLDGDTDLDFIVAGQREVFSGEHILASLELRPGGRYVVRQQLQTSDGFHTVGPSIADFDLDGDIDVVLSHYRGAESPYIIENLGGGRLAPPTPIDGNIDISSLHVDEVTDDSRWDLIATSPSEMLIWPNVTIIDNHILEVSPLVRGQVATLAVEGVEPGQRVHFVYTLNGAAPSRGVTALGGLTLDIAEPFILGPSAVADVNGRAEIMQRISDSAPLTTITLQAVERRGPNGADSTKSIFVRRRVGP